jgi:hypothetical protein
MTRPMSSGWYADRQDTRWRRYYDGDEWTNRTVPSSTSLPPEPTIGPPRPLWLIALMSLAAVLLILCTVAIAVF